MSTFNIYQKAEYAVMLADSLAQKTIEGGNVAPLLAPKLVHVASSIYAAHAGTWQPALKMLHRVYDYVASATTDILYEQFTESLSQIGKEIYAEYQKLWNKDVIDVRIALVVTENYRHPQDIQNGVTTTLLIWETANNFEPHRCAVSLCWAFDGKTTCVMREIINLPAIDYLLNAGPLSVAQALDAIHALIAKISAHVSQDTNIVVVSGKDEFSLLKGQLIRLPNRALLFG